MKGVTDHLGSASRLDGLQFLMSVRIRFSILLPPRSLPGRSRSRTSADRRSPIVEALKSTEEAGDPTGFERNNGTCCVDRLSEVLQ